MRLLRVDYAKSPSSLDLHPLVTVVDGLSDNERSELLEQVRRLARGSVGDLRGLAYRADELIEFDGGSGPLALGSTDVDPVVTDRRGVLDPVPGIEERVRLAQIEELRSQLAPGSHAEVLELRHRIVVAGDSPSARVTDNVESRTQLTESQDQTLAPTSSNAIAVDHQTYSRVGESFLAVQQIPRTNRVQSEAVVELQQRWSRFDARQAQGEQRTAELRQELANRTEQIAAAEQALRAAEEAARPVLLTQKQEGRLEELAEKSEGRSRRWRRSGQLSSGEQNEFDSLLRQVGAQSWTEYSVFRLAPSIDKDKQIAVDEAQAAFALAEAEADAAQQALDQDPLVAELEEERTQIRNAASQYLGALMPADLGQALLSLGQDEINPEWAGSVTELCRVLDQAQLEPDLSTDHSDDARSDFERSADQILNWTREWLASQEQAMADVQSQMSPAIEPVPAPTAAPGTDVRSGEDVEMLQAALSKAEQRLVDHRRALFELMSSASERPGGTPFDDGEMDDDVDVDTRSTSIGERLTQVVASATGDLGESLPVILDVDFGGFDLEAAHGLLDQCSELADQAQIIVLSSSPMAKSWVDAAGEQVAGQVTQPSLIV